MPWKYTHDKKTRPNLWLSVEMENFCSKTKSNLVTEEFYLMFQKSKPFDSLATLDSILSHLRGNTVHCVSVGQ